MVAGLRTAWCADGLACWLKREVGLSGPSDKVREFSERLAVELVAGREQRGGEFLGKAELSILAAKWDVKFEEWKLTGRSLLNRDAAGNFKFAHRSIMEYLFAESAVNGKVRCFDAEWTDQIYTFFFELLLAGPKTIDSFDSRMGGG